MQPSPVLMSASIDGKEPKLVVGASTVKHLSYREMRTAWTDALVVVFVLKTSAQVIISFT